MTSSVLHRDLQGTAETYCFLLAAWNCLPDGGCCFAGPVAHVAGLGILSVSKANPTRSEGEKVSAKVPELPSFPIYRC
jgi:hypothetical protein